MSNPILYTRGSSVAPLVKFGTFLRYSEAIEAGSATAGYGNFLIDTGAECPSRGEQLGEVVRLFKASTRRPSVKSLNHLANED